MSAKVTYSSSPIRIQLTRVGSTSASSPTSKWDGADLLLLCANEDGSPRQEPLRVTPDGPIIDGPGDTGWERDATIEVVGTAPQDFGEYSVLFRPPHRRDHIVQTTLRGQQRNVCQYNVDTNDGVPVPISEVTSRQNHLRDFCVDCSDYVTKHLADELEVDKDSKVDVEPFKCPECGEEPELIEHTSVLRPPGMVSEHEDGRTCGPWDPDIHLGWRLGDRASTEDAT